MTILDELLKEIDSSGIDEQVKILCDKIFEEEKEKINHISIIPKGPNVFLALEIPGSRVSEIAFATLERESTNKFIIVVWTTKKSILLNRSSTDDPITLRKKKAIGINEHEPKKILKKYAEFIKYMRGE